jgi:hypothetical protein
MRMADLRPGWAVVANDDHRVGTIREIGQQFLVVSRAGLGRPLYVPASAIANVDRQVVQLNLAKAQIDSMGWHQAPREHDELREAPEADLDRHV